MTTTYAGWERGATTRVLGAGTGSFSLIPVTLAEGRAVLYGIAGDVIRSWDPVDGSEAGPPIFTAQPVSHADAVVDRAGKPWIVVAYRTDDRFFRSLHFLDAATGLESRPPLAGPQLAGTRFCAVPLSDGRVLLAVNQDFPGSSPSPDGDPSTFYHTTTQLWDPETGTTVGPLHQPPSQKELNPRGSVVVDGHPMLIDYSAWLVRLWDLAAVEAGSWTPRLEFSFGAGASDPAIVPLPDGRTVAVAGVNEFAGTDDTHRLAAVDVHNGHPTAAPVVLPAFISRAVRLPLPGGGDLVAVVDDGAVRLFTPDTLTPVGPPLTGHDGVVSDIVAIRVGDGRVLLATSGFDDTVRVWEPVKPPPTTVTLTGHDGPVLALTPTTLPDGRTLLASGGRDKTLRLWDPITATPVGTPLTGHTGPVLALTSTPNILLSGSGDTTVRRWNPTTATPTGTALTGHRGPVGALTTLLLPDGHTLIISAGADATLLRWDATTGAPVGPPLTGHTGAVHAAITLGSPLVATAGDDTTVRLWNLTTGTLVATLTGHTGPVRALTTVHLSDGTTLLASAGDDTTVRLWNPTTATPVGTPLTGHTGPVRALTTLPRPHGPTLLASTGDDRSLRLWDPTTGTPAGDPLTGPTDTVRAAATITVPGGRTLLATAGDDATLTLWTIP